MGMYGGNDQCYSNGGMMAKKRVMVVVDETSRSKHAMMWALTHVTNKGDWLTLLHIIPSSSDSSSSSPNLAASLASLCKACKPEVIHFLILHLGFLVVVIISVCLCFAFS